MTDTIDTLDSTLRSHFEVLYVRQMLGRLGPRTRDLYRIDLRHFDEYLERPARVTDLTDATVAGAMQWLVDTGREKSTANKFRNQMLALWRFLARKRIVDYWPDVPPFPEPVRIPVAWTKEEMRRLFAACASEPGSVCAIEMGRWLVGLHSVIWDTAERISGVLSIRWADVDLRGRWIIVRAEGRKGKRADKISRLHPDTVRILRSIREPKRELVFPWPKDIATLYSRYRLVLKRAGLPNDRMKKFHCLRKSAASFFEAAGGDATKLLGHSSRAVTKKYLDPRVCVDQQASDVLFRPGK